MKVFWGATVCLAFLPLLLSADFLRRTAYTSMPVTRSEIAIVLTGQFDRVEAGLALLESDKVGMLFISGVNSGAGISRGGFAEQFALLPALRDALAQERAILASDATTTLENALEAACWLAERSDIRSALLVTHRFHMPRASLASERAVPWQITVLPVFTEQVLPGTDRPFVLRELFKFTATLGITLLPNSVWPSDISSDCGL